VHAAITWFVVALFAYALTTLMIAALRLDLTSRVRVRRTKRRS
jgi:hypothetical protein